MPKTRNLVTITRATRKSLAGLANVMFPVMISSLRSGKNLAVAADTRAFRAKRERTSLKEMKLKSLDKKLLILFTIIFTMGMVASMLGWFETGGGVVP